MGVVDAPQWLISAWTRSVRAVGSPADEAEVRIVGERLLERWSEPGRHFHNLRHLIAVLARVDELAEETHEPDVVRLAVWYHGAKFETAKAAALAHRGGEDEVASAALARHELTTLGVPAVHVERVKHLVTRMARHNPDPEDLDCAVLCDADLAVLAAEPQRYKTYLEEIREEYAHLPLRAFLEARQRIVAKLLGRPRIFVSPLGTAWEEPARQNLAMEQARLARELEKLDAAEASASAAGPDPAA